MFELPKYKRNEPFHSEETEYIRENWKIMKAKDIASHLGRSEWSVRCKAKDLGVLRYKTIKDSDIEFIRRNAEHMTAQQIGDSLGRSARSIFDLCYKVGISLQKYAENHHNTKLSDHDCELIRELRNTHKMTLMSIAEKFDCKHVTISVISSYKSREYDTGMMRYF